MPLDFRGIIAPTFQEKFLSGFILSGSAFYLSAFIHSASAFYENVMPFRRFTWLSEPRLIAAQQTAEIVSVTLFTQNKMNNIEQAINYQKKKNQNKKQAK